MQEVWGIGSKTAVRLNRIGITTVWDLTNSPAQSIQQQFNIVVARTVMELNGITYLDMKDIAPDKQQIVCSRGRKAQKTAFDHRLHYHIILTIDAHVK